MSDNLEKEKVELPCPGGGREIRTTYGDLARRSSLRSSKGHEYKFKSSDQSKFKRAMQNMSKVKDDYEDDVKDIQKIYQLEKKIQLLLFQERYRDILTKIKLFMLTLFKLTLHKLLKQMFH